MGYKKYEIIRSDRAADKSVAPGDTVYDSKGYDYGCSSDDTRYTGIEHISVTLDIDGGYPFFTIPVVDLQELPNV